MQRDKYKTKQKEQILEIIKKKNKEFTVKELCPYPFGEEDLK